MQMYASDTRVGRFVCQFFFPRRTSHCSGRRGRGVFLWRERLWAVRVRSFQEPLLATACHCAVLYRPEVSSMVLFSFEREEITLLCVARFLRCGRDFTLTLTSAGRINSVAGISCANTSQVFLLSALFQERSTFGARISQAMQAVIAPQSPTYQPLCLV